MTIKSGQVGARGDLPRTLLRALIVASTGVLGWSGAHWLSLRLADPHTHLHEHGIAHSSLTHGQQQLAMLHSYLGPTALLAAAVLVAGLSALRALPGNNGSRVRHGRAMLVTATISTAAFALVETVEHAITTHTGPPATLLLIGAAVHAAAGVAAAALSHTVIGVVEHRVLFRAHQPVAPARRSAPTPRPRALHPQALLAVLTGRAPPHTTAVPQLSV